MNSTALIPASKVSLQLANDTSWLDRTLYPFTPKSFETEGNVISYLDEGNGHPILFVHGTPSWSFEWRHSIAALREQYRCIAPDHLGFGLSAKPRSAPYRPSDHARRLSTLVTELDLRNVTLVVHDFGTPIGMSVAMEHPERIASLVVLNGWLWDHGSDRRIARLSRLVASPLGKLLYLGLNASPRWLIPSTFAERKRLTPRIHAQYAGPFPSWRERFGPWTLGCELAGSDPWYASLWQRREVLRGKPLTLVWGMKDPAFGSAYLERWCEAYPEATVHRLDDSGHFPQEEAPEAVTLDILDAANATR